MQLLGWYENELNVSAVDTVTAAYICT